MAFGPFPQFKIKKFKWQDIIFYSGLVLFLTLIIFYFIFILKIYFQEKRIQELGILIDRIATERKKELEKEVLSYQRKINDFSILLNSHKVPSNIFEFFEKNILPTVKFSEFRVSTKEPRVEIIGESDNIRTLAWQLSIFKKNKFVKEIKILNFKPTKEGGVIFNLVFSLDSEMLKYR